MTAHLSGRIESVTRGTTSMSVSPLCWSRIMEQIILEVTLKHTFQCVTTLCVKSCLLITNLNLPCLTSKPFPLVLSLSTLLNSRCPLLLMRSLRVLEGCHELSPELSLLPHKQSQFPQHFFLREVLQPSDHLRGPSLDLLQKLHIIPVLEPQAWTQCCTWGRTRAESRGTITSLSLLVAPL